MMLSLLAVALLQTPTWTDEAVLRAERVVVGKVERVFEERGKDGVPKSPHLALVRVSETFLGPQEGGELLVIDPEAASGMARLEVGSEAVLFLTKRRDDVGGEKRVQRLLSGAPRLDPLVRSEELRRIHGCPWLIPSGLQRQLEEERLPVDLLRVRAALELAFERVFPRLRAGIISTGIASWGIELGPRGEFTLSGKQQAPLSPEDASTLWRSIQALEPARLTLWIGRSPGPSSTRYWIELRDRSGLHRIDCLGLGLDDGATKDDALARFIALWKLLPGEGKPVLGS